MRVRAALVAALLLWGLAGVASGQSLRRRERMQSPRATPSREQLEQRLRTRLPRVVQQRVGLTDEQMSKLGQANRRFDARRRELVREERARRVELRTQVLAGQSGDQALIGTALDRVLEIQRERIDLQIEEQRQLAMFMSPLQRARYAALQEQIRRRLEGVRAGAAPAPSDSE